MKKLLAFLLAALTLLTACSTANSPSSSDHDNSNNSGDVSVPGEDVSIPPESEWDYRTLVSVGKTYTALNPAAEDYKDYYNQMLTDGEKTPYLGAHYSDPCMVGYVGDNTFILDLGADSKNVSEIVVRSVCMNSDGVKKAVKAKLYGSLDGVDYENFGTVTFPDTGDQTVSEAVWVLDEQKDYRYIRVEYQKDPYSHFIFLDEIEVYANVPPAQATDTAKEAYKNESVNREEWKELSTGIAAIPVFSKNVAVNSDYYFSKLAFDERALDEKTDAAAGTVPRLTDGDRTDRNFGEPVWVGISPETENQSSVTVTLKENIENVYAFKVYALSGVNIEFPAYIDIYGAESSSYTFLGRMYAPTDRNNYVYTFILPEYVKGKNFRFVFPKGTCYYWLEEIEVYAGYNEIVSDNLYPELTLPNVNANDNQMWDASESDYSTEQNLILGKTQQISALYYDSLDVRGSGETTANTKILTDGKTAKNTYCYSGDWFFTRGNAGVEIIYDLEKISSVSSVNISYLEQGDWGIWRPKFASIHLSEDGENWYKVGDYARGDASANPNATRMELNFDFEQSYAARFVRIRLEGGMMFIDEIEVTGTKQVDGNKAMRLADSGIIAAPFYTNNDDLQFATTENTPIKAKDIPIVYCNKSLPENLLPMVAYLDEEGAVKDTFMDGFLYCTSGILPSGKLPHLESYKTDWDYLFECYFNGQAGFDVLEATVQQVKDRLNKPDYKVQVYITFLEAMETVSDFGDVDGDGVTEDLSLSENRKKVYNWFISKCKNEFEARGYKNLELGGFYWMNEEVNWEKDDSHLITEAAECVHENGSYFIWIPYYAANRYYTGYELGFDLVSMQPNIVFTPDAPFWRIDSAVEFTKRRKMAIEIEHSYQAFGDPQYAATYLKYLHYGVLNGYDGAINIYYNDIDNLAYLGKSKDLLCRMQYDYTYQYTKDMLDITPDALSTYKANGSKNSVITGELNTGINRHAVFNLLTAPQHGYISLCADGTFRYFPNKDFTGTDTFTYTYNLLLGESEPCTIEITVK